MTVSLVVLLSRYQHVGAGFCLYKGGRRSYGVVTEFVAAGVYHCAILCMLWGRGGGGVCYKVAVTFVPMP